MAEVITVRHQAFYAYSEMSQASLSRLCNKFHPDAT